MSRFPLDFVHPAFKPERADMTDEERRMFSNRLRERDAEIERLRTAIREVLEMEAYDPGTDAYEVLKRALEPMP